LGSVRLLLAIAVVIAHSTPLLGLTFTGGMVSVQAFYIISGFYISLILDEKYRTGWAGTKLFYSNRFLRIFPVYWMILAISFVLAILEQHIPSIHTVGALGNFSSKSGDLGLGSRVYLLITNISLVGMDWAQFLRFDLPHLQPAIDALTYRPRASEFAFVPQAWTLGVELSVYLIAPFVFRRGWPVLLAIVVASTVARAFAFQHGLDKDPWTYRFFPFELALFVLGGLSYRAYRAFGFFSNRALGWACVVGVWALAICFPGLSTSPSILPGFEWGQLAFLLAISFAIPAIFHLSKTSKADRWAGELSYPVYLGHLIVIPMCNGSFGPGNIYPVAGSVVLAALVAVLVDKPLDRYRQARVHRAGAGPILRQDSEVRGHSLPVRA
jgi:peptidoglycan/LPS O-acetylase OafA/YrhL